MQKTPLTIVITGILFFLVMASFKPKSPVPQRYPSWVVEHDTLLEIEKELGLRPEYPTIFTFDLKEGDSIFFECRNFSYILERGVGFTWVTPTSSLQLDTAQINLGITAPLPGEYRLEIQVKRRIGINRKSFERIEDFVVHRYRGDRKDIYQPETYVNVKNMYVGDEADKGNISNPVFRTYVGKEDSMVFTFSPVDQAKVENLVLEVKAEGNANPTSIYVDASGIVSWERSRSVRSSYLLIQLKTNSNQPFYKKEQDFYNLTAVRIPKPLRQTSSTGGIVLGEDLPEATEEEGQPKSAAELLFEEYLKGQKFEDIEVVDGRALSISVPAKLQLNGNYRTCRPIEIPPSDVFVYWLGAGDEAMDEYKVIDTYQGQINANPRDVGDIMTRYARSIVIRENPRDNLFRGEGESDAFTEYIEYGIFDERGKNAFLEGKPIANKYVNEDHGFATNLTNESLYLCLCNHNRVSKVEVAFKYGLFKRYTEE